MPDKKPQHLNVLPSNTATAAKIAQIRSSAPAGGTGAEAGRKLNDESVIDRALDASLTPQQRQTKEKVVEALQQVYDPELPVNLYDLGLIYRLELAEAEGEGEGVGGEGQHVEIDMTLTAPGCPVAGTLPGEVQKAVQAVPGVVSAKVNLVWEPRWDKSRMSEVALLELGLM